MNPIQLFTQIISQFWWLFFIIIIINLFKSPFIKGTFGELIINLAVKIFLDKNIYQLFKNVTLPTEDGTTQIDHVIVSPYGIFVVETKNMKGWIFGSPHQKTWTQRIYKHTTKFQNPLHQNYKHTKTLQSALEIDLDNIFSLVVFVGNSEFKTPMPDNVVYVGGCIRYIKNKKNIILTDSEVNTICTQIKYSKLEPSIKTHINHIKHVRDIVENKQYQAKAKITLNDTGAACPKCGEEMVLRTAKRGNNQGKQFWGCSGFPKCRTIRTL